MNIDFLADFMVPVIIGICLMVGYIIKHWIKDVDNKIIPTLCALLGVALALWMNWGNITPEVILSGLASGLASTGLHQAFTQLLGK
jgi:Na+/glutamate symporter